MASVVAIPFSNDVIETGARFEVVCNPTKSNPTLQLPELFDKESIGSLEDAAGNLIDFVPDPTSPTLRLKKPLGMLNAASAANCVVWLECLRPGNFRLSIAGDDPSADPDHWISDKGIRIDLDSGDQRLLNELPSAAAQLPDLRLALRAARLATVAGFDQLICLPLVREMDLLEHQIRTAKTVLGRFRGRALLCDEVGLGKTIEAGLVLSELVLRGLARSVLILTPPSLVEQWLGELRRKFSLSYVSHDDPSFRELGADAWQKIDGVVASIHTAKREPHRSAILARKWDIVIVDEAHHLRNRTTQLWKFASQLEKQFILLLTATPVQNNLEELFNLVTLLEPGLLRTVKHFQNQFVGRKDKLTPKNLDELHGLLREVMVRNQRNTVGLQFTRRLARTERVPLAPAERELYAAVSTFVHGQLAGAAGDNPDAPADAPRRGRINRMTLLTLQMALGSSAPAAAGMLENLADNTRLEPAARDALLQFAGQARRVEQIAKADWLLKILNEFSDKMVVFTQFRATQDMLAGLLDQAGIASAVFHGGLARLEKEAAIARFRGPARVLLATESGSEGRNLQFAHGICNFDLPWNPMRIEQRIGRLSRIGQTRDVHVFNLAAVGTVEDAILRLLEAKLNMFELVIGEIDMVLGNLEDEREFHDLVADAWAGSQSDDEFAHRMDELGERLLTAKKAYFAQRAHDDRIFGDRFAADR